MGAIVWQNGSRKTDHSKMGLAERLGLRAQRPGRLVPCPIALCLEPAQQAANVSGEIGDVIRLGAHSREFGIHFHFDNASAIIAFQARMHHFPEIAHAGDHRLANNLILRDDGIRLTWIPKNMCSTLKLSFMIRGRVAPESAVTNLLKSPGMIHEWTLALEPFHAHDLAWPTSVAVLRHPAARLRSGLIEKAIHLRADFDWVIKPVLERYARYTQKPIEEQTAADFLRAILMIPDRLLDVHLRSQIGFLSGDYTHLLRMEDDPAAFFQARGIRLFTVDAHSISRGTGDLRVVRADEPLLALRQEMASPRPPLRLEPRLDALLCEVAARRYEADLRLWESVAPELGSAQSR